MASAYAAGPAAVSARAAVAGQDLTGGQHHAQTPHRCLGFWNRVPAGAAF